ncbi:MAG: 8-amino-7-oxononanoate synthase [Nevskiaceae bacterium]|jgi:8-amino-7-oxononanoate synthase|nr:8-amino-7-oxononanoate synthase [Nevskiaceae bacterium]
MHHTPQAASDALRDLTQAGLRRQRRIIEAPNDELRGASHSAAPAHRIVNGRALLDFCSNDYLGLSRDPRIAEAVAQGARRWGAGAGAAHLVSGHTREHHALEEELAAFTGRQAALLFSTGYMANLGALTALAARGEVILADRLNHASLIDGAQLSGARLLRYAHVSPESAQQALQSAGDKATVLVTDGVFSMDGDVAPLPALARLAAAHRAWLIVDDAHGLGVTGPTGRGSLEAFGLTARDAPVLVGTLGKALGGFGAFLAGDHDLVEWVMQRARSYLFTTALPPAIAAGLRAALRICEQESWRREHLMQLVARFRAGLQSLNLPMTDSLTPIQPIVLGDAQRCLDASRALAERGFLVAAIRRPTVPAGTERLRVTLSAAHTPAHVDALLEALHACLPIAANDPRR